MEIQLSVITVVYNQAEFIQNYIQSLIFLSRHYCLEVLVIDNASTDSGLLDLKAELGKLPESISVELIESEVNLGFSRACNQLSALAKGEVLLFLNPDALAQESDLAVCYQLAREGGISSPALEGQDGRRYACSSPFYDRYFFPLFKLKYLFRLADQRTLRVDWVQGACLFVQRLRFLAVSGFCEDYFLYTEDMELAKQFSLRQWPVWLVQSESVVHPKTQIKPMQMQRIYSNLRTYFQGRHRLSFDLYQCLLWLVGRISYAELRFYFRLSLAI